MKYFNRNALAALAIGLVSLVIFALMPSPLEAQSFYGSLIGTVTDASGATIPGAAVTVTNIGTNNKHSANSDGAGNYRFVNLVPADYRLEVEKTGFKRMTREPITVRVESAVRIDVTLDVGAVSETIEVTSTTPLLQTESGTISQVVEGEQVQQMPLNGRNVVNLIALTAGVVPQGSSMGPASLNQTDHTNPTGWGNFQIGGGVAGQSAMYIDGGPINVLSSNQIGLVITQDAVQEFRVATNSVSPEFGRFGGGVVNMATKSGANGFHGSAYEYLRNKVFNANDFFSNMNGSARPKWNQNQYGAVVSGPVVKDKVFFFFSWEGFHSRVGTVSPTNVPTDDMRAGTFHTAISDPTGRDCVSHTDGTGVWQIKSACLNSTAQYIQGLYWKRPNSNNPQNNFFAAPVIGDDYNQYTGRVDYNISNKQRLFGRFTYWNMEGKSMNEFDNPLTGNSSSNNRSHQLVLGDTYTFNPTTILDVRASYFRDYFDDNPPSLGVDLTPLGANWVTLGKQMTYVELPAIGFGRSTNLWGSRGNNTNFNRTNNYDLAAGLNKIKGSHNLKFGAEFRLMDHNYGGGRDLSGNISFDWGPAVGDDYAAFLMGIPDSGNIASAAPISDFNYYQGYYVADTWQVGKKLTLNFGLRWELPGSIAEKHDRATVLLPNALVPGTNLVGTLALVKSALYSDRHVQEVKHHLFAPRVGLAYRLTNDTVLRAGYGLAYIPPDIPLGILSSNSTVNAAATRFSNSGLAADPTLYTYLSNPFPGGIRASTGRANPNFMLDIINQNQNISSPYPYQSFPYMQQWNLSLGHQFGRDLMVDIGYAGARGTNLPLNGSNLNELAQQYWANPSQALRPYPQYNTVSNSAPYGGKSNYHSLQAKVEKRFKSGGVLMANYTWAKNMGNADSQFAWLEAKAGTAGGPPGGGGPGAYQDYNNMAGEYSLSSFDVRQRLNINYVVDLPFGKGKKLANYGGVAGALVSGWAINGIVTFQDGFPLGFYTDSNALSRQYGYGSIRPNVVPGCDETISGSAQSRLGKWFNTACFVPLQGDILGDAPRVDSKLRAQGVNNWDLSILKTTTIKEQVNVQFRAELFNLFNRVQFGPPDTNVSAHNPNYGTVTNAANQPRLIQFSLRLNF